MNQCRDCGAALSTPQALLCPVCRNNVVEKRKARKRALAREAYRKKCHEAAAEKNSTTATAAPEQQMICATGGCANPVFGKARFCPDCRIVRRRVFQQHYRDRRKAQTEDLPAVPPTSLQWLDGFSDWAKSGMSYADYQREGMGTKHK